MLHTTLRILRDKKFCDIPFNKGLEDLSSYYEIDAMIPMSAMLALNGLHDTLWAIDLGVVIGDVNRLNYTFGIWCARQSLCKFESKYPNDKSPHEHIEACESFLRGEISEQDTLSTKVDVYIAHELAVDDGFKAKSWGWMPARQALGSVLAIGDIVPCAGIAELSIYGFHSEDGTKEEKDNTRRIFKSHQADKLDELFYSFETSIEDIITAEANALLSKNLNAVSAFKI